MIRFEFSNDHIDCYVEKGLQRNEMYLLFINVQKFLGGIFKHKTSLQNI